MVAVSAFRQRVAGRTPGILDYVIDIAVLDTCVEFCDETLIVKQTLDPVRALAGTNSLEVDLPAQTALARVMRVWVDGLEIFPRQEDDVDGPRGLIVTGATPVTRPRFFFEDSRNLNFDSVLDKDYDVVIRAALKPSRSATEVADVLLEDWVEVITHGALYRILSQPDGDSSRPINGPLAADHLRLYQAGLRAAMLHAQRGNARGELSITPVRIK